MEFPTLVYRNGGKHSRPGGTYGTAPASDEEQIRELLDDGWFISLPEAIEGKHYGRPVLEGEETDENKPLTNNDGPTREQILTKAKELDIKHHHNLGDDKIRRLIDAKLADME